MEAHRTETTVGGDGSVTVRDLPFPEGVTVEVIVLPAPVRDEPPGAATDDRPPRQFGSLKGLITVPDDFDDPLDDFAPYM